MNRTLHYIYDPQCGWCYGASRLVSAAADVKGLSLVLHGGGLWPQATNLPDATRRYIQQADARIAQVNSVSFGDAYLSGLLLDPDLNLESRPTVAAVLAADTCREGGGLEMLNAIQHAHYVEGQHVVRRAVLEQLAAKIGLEAERFSAALNDADPDAHIAASRQLMAQIGAGGFPAFALEMDGRLYGVPHTQFAGNAQGFADWLQHATPSAATN